MGSMSFLKIVASGLPDLSFYLLQYEEMEVHMHLRVRLLKLKLTHISISGVTLIVIKMKGKKEGNLLTVLLRLSPATLDKQ
jgi:hypothetical protein